MDLHDPEAFRALYAAHYRTVCRFLAVRADADAVEDVAAETFLVAWRRQGDLPADPVPWLLNTAAKCLANQRRSRARAGALVERLSAVTAAGPGLDDAVASNARRRALIAALAALPERERDVLLLHHWHGLAARQIAAVLEMNPVLARTRLHRAGRLLQRELTRRLAGEDLPSSVELTEAT